MFLIPLQKLTFTDNNTNFDTNGVQFVINPYDEFVLTRAMWFKEKQGAAVTVVNVGSASTESTLRKGPSHRSRQCY